MSGSLTCNVMAGGGCHTGRVPDQDPEPGGAPPSIDQQIPRLRHGPRSVRVRGRNGTGNSRARPAITIRSAQSSWGLRFCRRSTATSWRSTSSSASFDAADRASSTIHPARRTNIPFAEAVARVRQALKDQGFGVLTEIDVQATLRDKLGQDMEDYLILGACNPPLAHRALAADRKIGLLLPCNVVVRTAGAQTIIEALNPQVMAEVAGQPSLKPVADEATGRIRAALDSLQDAGGPAR